MKELIENYNNAFKELVEFNDGFKYALVTSFYGFQSVETFPNSWIALKKFKEYTDEKLIPDLYTNNPNITKGDNVYIVKEEEWETVFNSLKEVYRWKTVM